MKKNYDLYEELKRSGFNESVTEYGLDSLTRTITEEQEICWYGKQKLSITVQVIFNRDHSALSVYYREGAREPFKTKAHLNDKKAYNAIAQTVTNKGFTF